MGHMLGYEDWDEYSEFLCKATKDSLDQELVERVIEKLRVWNGEHTIRRNSTLVKFLETKEEVAPLPKILIFAGYFGVAGEVSRLLKTQFGERAVTEFR